MTEVLYNPKIKPEHLARKAIVDRLHRTGKLILQGGCAEDQLALFTENQGDDNAWYPE